MRSLTSWGSNVGLYPGPCAWSENAAVLWRNVDQDGAADVRTVHRGLPVEAPHEKMGVNIWVY